MASYLIVAGLTGALLAFFHELDRLINPLLFNDPSAVTALPLSPQSLVDAIERQLPDARVRVVPLRHEPGINYVIRVRPRIGQAGQSGELSFDQVFVVPSTGEIVGKRMFGAVRPDLPHLMPFLYELHYTLHIPEWGEWVMGVVAVIWLFDCFVGFYLTLPIAKRADPRRAPEVTRRLDRGWWNRWKPAWQIKRGASAYRVNFDLHRAGGLWLWLVLVLLALTSVYLNFGNQIFRPAVNAFSPLTLPPTTSTERVAVQRDHPSLPLEEALRLGKGYLPPESSDLQPESIGYLPAFDIYRVGFNFADKSAWFRYRYTNVYVDGVTGALRKVYGSDVGSAGDVFIALQFPIHNGQILGLPGRILICVAGLVTAMLSITGIVVWLKKRRARNARRSKVY